MLNRKFLLDVFTNMRLATVLLAILCVVSDATARQDSSDLIQGFVLDENTRQPLENVRIQIADHVESTAISDRLGGFTLRQVPPGRHKIIALKEGYVPGGYPGHPELGSGVTLSLRKGESIRNMVFLLVPQGTIAGRILDDSGQPIAHATVQAYRREYNEGRLRWTPALPANRVRTDDRGEFRAFWLDPGSYCLAVSAPLKTAETSTENDVSTTVPTFYPGTPDISLADAIQVESGREFRIHDLMVTASRLIPIRGRIIVPGLMPLSGVQLAIQRSGSIPLIAAVPFKLDIDGDSGRFELAVPAAGTYDIRFTWKQNKVAYLARSVVEVSGGDVDGIQILAQPGSTINGRIFYAPDHPAPFADVRLNALDGLGETLGATADAAGNFSIDNVMPLRYAVGIDRVPDEVGIDGVLFNRVFTAAPEITPSAGANDALQIQLRIGRVVQGTVFDSRQIPAPGALAVLIPSDPARRDLFRTAQADQAGTFSFHAVTPGRYRIAAWDDAEPGAVTNLSFLGQIDWSRTGKDIEITDAAIAPVAVALTHAVKLP